jgi:ferredoxin
MSVKKVRLDESENECISCGACEDICPEVFSVPEKMVVKTGVDFSLFEAEILDAIESCPVGVIKYD